MANEHIISLTHFVNPHNFWYTNVNTTSEYLRKREYIENCLAEAKARNSLKYHNHRYTWEEFEKVAVFFVSWNRVIRGKYLKQIPYVGKNEEHLIWAIDYGFPFSTSSKFILQLPTELEEGIGNVHWGGIANIFPAKLDFDFNKRKAVPMRIEKWSEQSVKLLEDSLNDAAHISFICNMANSAYNHHWGDLKIVNHQGDTFYASEMLLETFNADEARNVDNEFNKFIRMENSPHQLITLLCQNINYIKKNDPTNFSMQILQKDSQPVSARPQCDEHILDKVEDWKTFGDDLSSQRSKCSPRSRTFTDDLVSVSEVELGASASNLCDIPSAAVGEIQRNNIYDLISEDAILALEKDIPFEISTSLKSATSAASVIKEYDARSLRAEKLLQMRRKHKDSQKTKTDSITTASRSSYSTRGEDPVLVPSRLNKNPYGLSSGQELEFDSDLLKQLSLASKEYHHQEPRKVDAQKPSNTHNINNQSAANSGNKSIKKANSAGTKITIIPAGYDENNLRVYKNQNHWHCKKTTLNDYVPHDVETLMNENITSDKSVKTVEPNSKEDNQNFRFTRPNTDKHKKNGSSRAELLNKILQIHTQHCSAELNSNAEEKQSDVQSFKQTNNSCDEDSVDNQKTESNSDVMISNKKQRAGNAHRNQRKMNVGHDDLPKCEKFQNQISMPILGYNPSLELNQNPNGTKSAFNQSSLSEVLPYEKAKSSDYSITSDENNYKQSTGTTRAIQKHSINYDECKTSEYSITSDEYNYKQSTGRVNQSSHKNKHNDKELYQNPQKTGSDFEKHSQNETSNTKSSEYSITSDENYIKQSTQNSSNFKDTQKKSHQNPPKSRSDSENRSHYETSKSKSSEFSTTLYENNSKQSTGILSQNSQNIKNIHKGAATHTNTGTKNPMTVIKMPLATKIADVEGENELYNKTSEHWIMAHSKIAVYPLKRIEESSFLEEIQNAMRELRMNKLHRLQSYSWSYLQSNNSMFVVFPKGSGKTWSYLPSICSLVAYRQYCRQTSVERAFGPIAIILVTSSYHVEKVYSDCRRLMVEWHGEEIQPCVGLFGVRNYVNAKLQLLNSCGILITTPACMLRILEDNENESLISPQRLRHLVVDDIDLMYSRSKIDVESAIKSIIKLSNYNKTHQTSRLQLVITSRIWDPALIPFIQKSSEPLLLIGNFLEASVYGKSSISIKFVNENEKHNAILKFLKLRPAVVRERNTIIFCNTDEEVKNIETTLNCSEYECLAYSSNTTNEMRYKINAWMNKNSSYEVLVCTDDTFAELRINQVKYLIHYSIPTSWTKFTTRYYALTGSYANLVAQNFQSDNCNSSATKSLVLLDEGNTMQLPRLLEFMRIHNKDVHPKVLNLSKSILAKRENSRMNKNLMLCKYILEFGECLDNNCMERHTLTKQDRLTENDGIPSSGNLRIIIQKVVTPTHFIARLLQHKAPQSSTWKHVLRSNEYSTFFTSLSLHYADAKNLVIHWPLQAGDICIYSYQQSFCRARILDIKHPIKCANFIADDIAVVINLIDIGKIIYDIKANTLLKCDRKFKDFPEQAMNIRLMNVVPHDDERIWDITATKVVQKWLINDMNFENKFIQVSINMAMKHTIWVNNVEIVEDLPTVKQCVSQMNLKRSLLEKGFAVLNKKEPLIYKYIREQEELCDDLNETVESINITQNELKNSICDSNAPAVEPSMDLIEFSRSETTFDEINHSLVQQEEVDANACTKDDEQLLINLSSNSEADEGSQKEAVAETTVQNNNNPITATPELHCDETAASELQCDALEAWREIPLNQFTKVEIGDESENGNWSNIFLQVYDEESYGKFLELCAFIQEHVNKIKEESSLKDQTDLALRKLPPMYNCIVKYDNLYQRAKLLGIFGANNTKRIYRFFLCDYGCYVTCKETELNNDFFYESTKEIIEYIPFQAIHCTLVGVQIDVFAKRHLITLPYSFVYPVTKNETKEVCLNGLPICSFKVIFYETDDDKSLSNAIMLNKNLIDLGVAVADPETEHFLNGNFVEKFKPKFVENVSDNNVENVDENGSDSKTSDSDSFSSDKNKVISVDELIKRLSEGKFDDDSMDAVDLQSKPIEAIENNANNSLQKTMNKKNNADDFSKSSIVTATTKKETPRVIREQPALISKTKTPLTTWSESDILIYLVIHAPDIKEYFLKVTEDTVIFCAIVESELQTLILNLLGKVDPTCVSHEIRGLNVVVRMAKTVFMRWPRLVKQTEKFHWLKYNINYIELDSLKQIIPSQAAIDMPNDVIYSDANDSDDEDDFLQTFNPIENTDEIFDPLS